MARDAFAFERARLASGVRRAALAAACALAAAALAVSPVAACAQEGGAQGAAGRVAEAQGCASVEGVAGLEGAAFGSLDELAEALSACELPGTYVVSVHGSLPASSMCELPCVAGGSVELAGDGQPGTAISGTAEVACAGSLAVRGLAFDGPASLGAQGGLVVSGCSLPYGLTCASGASAVVSGNAFAAAGGASGAACSAALTQEGSSLSFSGNDVAGFTCGLGVTQASAAGSGHVTVGGNVFSLAQASGGPARPDVTLAGGPWKCAQVTFDGNVTNSADALVLLAADFSLEPAQGERALALSSGELGADAARVFEVAARGSGDAAPVVRGVSADASLLAEEVLAQQVQAASDAAFPQVASASAAPCVVTYDANGASAGSVPDPASVEAGGRVALATCSSLVKPGSEFRGWNTQPDGSGTFYAAGQVVTVPESLTLYAQWSAVGTVASFDVASAQGAE